MAERKFQNLQNKIGNSNSGKFFEERISTFDALEEK